MTTTRKCNDSWEVPETAILHREVQTLIFKTILASLFLFVFVSAQHASANHTSHSTLDHI